MTQILIFIYYIDQKNYFPIFREGDERVIWGRKRGLDRIHEESIHPSLNPSLHMILEEGKEGLHESHSV